MWENSTLSAMRTRIGKNIGIVDDTTYNAKINDWINEVYEDIWDGFLWPQSIVRGTVATVINQDFITLPYRVYKLLNLSQQVTPWWMVAESPTNFVRKFYNSLDSGSTGTSKDYTDDGESPVLAQPSAASVVSVSSSSASDLSQTVRVWGRDANGVSITDSIALNGTTVVAGTTSFTSIEQMNKSATTVGTVTATSNAAAVTLSRIAPAELTMRVIRIRLHLIPDAAFSLFWVGKDRVIKLQNNEDIPKIECDRAIVAGATALALREQADPESEIYSQRAEGIIRRMRDQVLGQSDRMLRINPYISKRYNVRGSIR